MYQDYKTTKDRLPKPECDWVCYTMITLIGMAVGIIIAEIII